MFVHVFCRNLPSLSLSQPSPSSLAISTAAMEMLGGDPAIRMSRKPEIMADAAYAILTKNSREATGNFFIDDDILKSAGITDLDKYANVPGKKLGHSLNPLLTSLKKQNACTKY